MDAPEVGERAMSDEFDRLDATDKAAIATVLNRCRVLAAKIANELRKKRPEHFVDELSLADIHDFLERAADVLSTVKGFAGAGTSVPTPNGEDDTTRKTEQSDQASSPNKKPESCYCSALPKGSGLCLPCYTQWLAGGRS
jgi:hypothetical protein